MNNTQRHLGWAIGTRGASLLLNGFAAKDRNFKGPFIAQRGGTEDARSVR